MSNKDSEVYWVSAIQKVNLERSKSTLRGDGQKTNAFKQPYLPAIKPMSVNST